jgi:hypothetical protein
MEPISTSILAALGAGGALADLFTPKPTPVLHPGPGPGSLPGAPVGVYPDASGQMVPPVSAAMHALQMNPSGMPPTAETSPIMQALAAARAVPAVGDALGQIPSRGPAQGGGTPAPAAPPAAASPKAPTQPSAPFNPAPGANANSGADVSREAMGGSAAAGAASAAAKSKFLGLDGDQWGAIGVASGILAQLFKPGPPVHVLTPSGGGPGALPMQQLGADLAAPGSQHLGTTSQFAISSPSIGGAYGAHTSDLLKSLQG